MIRCESVPIRKLDGSRTDGPYKQVARTLRGKPVETWWDEDDRIISVEPESAGYPYRLFVTDLDGSVVQSEGEGKFFYERRNALMREAGIDEDDATLNRFQTHIWQWDRDIYHSAENMIFRIKNGEDVHGNPLDADEASTLKQLTDLKNLRMWAEKVAPGTYADEQLNQFAPKISADRLEQIGMEILREQPEKVLTLAPFFPGAVEFFKSIPEQIPIAIASGSFRTSTIKPILDAHAVMGNPFMRDRVGNLIAGAEDVIHAKPDPFFYMEAQIAIVKVMRAGGIFPPGGMQVRNILFFGDSVGGQGVDADPKRRHSVVVINTGTIASPGPLSAVAANFSELMLHLQAPIGENSPYVIQRLARTIR